jgi:molybdopterin/thiamine biosynthesis adenylyltransferase
MMRRVAIAATDISAVVDSLGLGLETAAVSIARTAGDTLLVGQADLIREEEYEVRESDRLAVRSGGWYPAFRAALRSGDVPVWIHTHPSGKALFSPADNEVDATIAGQVARVHRVTEHLSIVVAGGTKDYQVVARLCRAGLEPVNIAVRVVGNNLRLHLPFTEGLQTTDTHDRQHRAFGPANREILAGLRVGLVGAGGTGSPTAEQLLRLGVGYLAVIDDDEVTETTPSRGYGSGLADVGLPKVEVIKRLSEQIGFGVTDVDPLNADVRDPGALDRLASCDVIFCCTDGHASRVVLNRVAYWHLIPVVDTGVLVSTSASGLERVDARVSWIAPGTACLMCRGRVDTALAHAEVMDPEERKRQAGEGYVPEISSPAPAVVTYTTHVSAAAVGELFKRLFGLGDTSHSEQLLQLDVPSVRLNSVQPREGCFCAQPDRWGRGYEDPRLDLTW